MPLCKGFPTNLGSQAPVEPTVHFSFLNPQEEPVAALFARAVGPASQKMGPPVAIWGGILSPLMHTGLRALQNGWSVP